MTICGGGVSGLPTLTGPHPATVNALLVSDSVAAVVRAIDVPVALTVLIVSPGGIKRGATGPTTN